MPAAHVPALHAQLKGLIHKIEDEAAVLQELPLHHRWPSSAVRKEVADRASNIDAGCKAMVLAIDTHDSVNSTQLPETPSTEYVQLHQEMLETKRAAEQLLLDTRAETEVLITL